MQTYTSILGPPLEFMEHRGLEERLERFVPLHAVGSTFVERTIHRIRDDAMARAFHPAYLLRWVLDEDSLYPSTDDEEEEEE